jgi:hypothetical protein
MLTPIKQHTAVLHKGKISVPKDVLAMLFEDRLEVVDDGTKANIISAPLEQLQNLKKSASTLFFTYQNETFALAFTTRKYGLMWGGPALYFLNWSVPKDWITTIEGLLRK